MKVDLAGRVALVTGAAGGIGTAIGAALAANGCRVVHADIDIDGARRRAAATPDGIAVRMDVTNAAEVEAAFAETIERCGRLDILVNNAGINTMSHRVTVEDFPVEEWERILRVDLTGLFLVSRAAAKLMLTQAAEAGPASAGRQCEPGRIINIASVLGLVPARLQSPFVAAKAGVVNLTRSMALELGGRGVLVNCIAPGSILTAGTKQLFYGADGRFHERVQALLAHIPVGRPGTCEEVAHAVLFLADPESSYINGAVLPVDGGWLAGYIREF